MLYQIRHGDRKQSAEYDTIQRLPCCLKIKGQWKATEIIGGKSATIEIDFVTPEEFGFSRELMDENNHHERSQNPSRH